MPTQIDNVAVVRQASSFAILERNSISNNRVFTNIIRSFQSGEQCCQWPGRRWYGQLHVIGIDGAKSSGPRWYSKSFVVRPLTIFKRGRSSKVHVLLNWLGLGSSFTTPSKCCPCLLPYSFHSSCWARNGLVSVLECLILFSDLL